MRTAGSAELSRRRRVLALALPPTLHLATTVLLAWGTAAPISALRGHRRIDLDGALGLAAAVGAWCALTWLAVGTLVTVIASIARGPGGRHDKRRDGLDDERCHEQDAASRGGLGARGGADRLDRAADRAPWIARRLAGLLLGVGLVTGPLTTASALAEPLTGPALADQAAAGAALADQVGTVTAGTGAPTGVPALDRPAADPQPPPSLPPGWTPDRPAAPPRRAAPTGALSLVTTTPHRARAVAEEVVVRRGDSLWDIAARHLGPDASAADIAAEWPRWYVANRSLVGPDPDLIRPGQRLRPPRL
ncbi:MAG TPA: LysM domain-containing protein [Actinomycetes bacterium]